MGRGRGQNNRMASGSGPSSEDKFSVKRVPIMSPIDNPVFRTRVEKLLQTMLLQDSSRRNIRVNFGSSGSHTDLKGAIDKKAVSTITLDQTIPPAGTYGERHCAILGVGTHEIEHEISTHGAT